MDREIYYETKISDRRWIAYDIPGNIGWIMYMTCIVICFKMPAGFMYDRVMAQMVLFAIIPALWMLIGIAELINERINKLDRVLTRRRLIRGFGSLLAGGVTGACVSAAALINFLTGEEIKGSPLLLELMLAGALLCTVFSWLIYKGYREK